MLVVAPFMSSFYGKVEKLRNLRSTLLGLWLQLLLSREIAAVREIIFFFKSSIVVSLANFPWSWQHPVRVREGKPCDATA